jgi:hypothetical protein
MLISGHKTRSMFDRYNITDERDIQLAGQRLERYLEEESKVVTENLQCEANKNSQKPRKGLLCNDLHWLLR